MIDKRNRTTINSDRVQRLSTKLSALIIKLESNHVYKFNEQSKLFEKS